MNLVSVMVAAAIGVMVFALLGESILHQTRMTVYNEYLLDTGTARQSVEMRVDCKKIDLNKCEASDKNGVLVIGQPNLIVGRAEVKAVCDSEGANLFVRNPSPQAMGHAWKALVPLKICGGGSKVCNLQINADGISCEGGSKSY